MEQNRISEILLKTLGTDSSWKVREAAASALRSLLPKLGRSMNKPIEETIARFQRAREIHEQELRDQDDGC